MGKWGWKKKLTSLNEKIEEIEVKDTSRVVNPDDSVSRKHEKEIDFSEVIEKKQDLPQIHIIDNDEKDDRRKRKRLHPSQY